MADKTVKISGREQCAGVDDYTTPNAGSDKQKSPDFTTEHQTIESRITGKKHEIDFGPLPGGLVPANPFASEMQRGYMNAHPEVLGEKGLKEWNSASKGLKLPKSAKK